MSTVVLTSSPFLRRHLQERHGVDSTVIYPIVDGESYRTTPGPSGHLTMINPVPVKGLQTLLGIVDRLPRYPFLIVEGWRTPTPQALHQALARFPNVRVIPAQADVRE